MKLKIKAVIYSILLIIVGFISCKKEMSCEGCAIKKNKTPIAVAGPDQVITLPTDSILLDGRSSSDPDGAISRYAWTKISGPVSFSIVSPMDSLTKVKRLVSGTYFFELKVTDNGGLSAKDTLMIIVDPVLTTNHPPIAIAGSDQSFTLPTNSVNLDGSASSDPENNITAYLWTKIYGPTSFNFVNANTVQTQLINLTEGVYQFELKVTDAGGLFSRDTIQLTVNPATNSNCILSQTMIGSLSVQRSAVNILQAGNKILFAGGFVSGIGPPMYGASSRVDIYDRITQHWSTAELSLNRFGMGTATLGNKIYFAGGDNGRPCSRVDIYDASNNTWSTAELSEPREDVVAVAAGNKVLFAGGISSSGRSTRVDIYDQANGSWSTASLSHPISGNYPGYYVFSQSGVIAAGYKIYFVTNSNSIDIYNSQTNTWFTHMVGPNLLSQLKVMLLDDNIYFSSSANVGFSPGHEYANNVERYDITTDNWSSIRMYQSRADMAAIAGDGKLFWAGGFDSSWDVNGEEAVRPVANIEVYDVTTGMHSFHQLQNQEWWIKALKTDNKIFFFYRNYTETYDMISHSWTICPVYLDHAFAIGNTIYNVESGSRISKLEF